VLDFRFVLNGGHGPTRDTPTSDSGKYHDIILFLVKSKENHFSICEPLYQKGCSIREIAKITNLPKSTVLDSLRAGGIQLRTFKKTERRQPKASMPSGTIPYGYTYLEGELVKNPGEFKVILLISRLWTSGQSFNAIATTLNSQNIPTRMSKRWTRATVARILKRHNQNPPQEPK
jgi:hypothetical protein